MAKLPEGENRLATKTEKREYRCLVHMTGELFKEMPKDQLEEKIARGFCCTAGELNYNLQWFGIDKTDAAHMAAYLYNMYSYDDDVNAENKEEKPPGSKNYTNVDEAGDLVLVMHES